MALLKPGISENIENLLNPRRFSNIPIEGIPLRIKAVDAAHPAEDWQRFARGRLRFFPCRSSQHPGSSPIHWPLARA